MAITREDLLAYQAEKKQELQDAATKKAVDLDEVEAKVKEYKDNLVSAVVSEYEKTTASINAEIKLLDNLLEKEAKQEELL
jgi:hypothetical protein